VFCTIRSSRQPVVTVFPTVQERHHLSGEEHTGSDPRNDVECIDHIATSDEYLFISTWQDHQ